MGLPTHIRLLEPIGAGASATVWHARDRAAGVDVAVKVLRRRPGDPPVGERIEREGRALARLGGHEGVLGVYALGGDDESGWIVTELVDGGSLRDRAESLPMDPAGVLRLGASAAEGLAHAHRHDVVHGDVSPGNIFVRADGGAVLGDFGLSVIDRSDRVRTKKVRPVGLTPGFAAPELRRGGPSTAASDVYGLGAVLWWVATGATVPRPDAPVPAGLGERLAAVLAATTRRDPTSRPTAAAVAARCSR